MQNEYVKKKSHENVRIRQIFTECVLDKKQKLYWKESVGKNAFVQLWNKNVYSIFFFVCIQPLLGIHSVRQIAQSNARFCACSINNNRKIHFMSMNVGQPQHIYSFVNVLGDFLPSKPKLNNSFENSRNCEMCSERKRYNEGIPSKAQTHPSARGQWWLNSVAHSHICKSCKISEFIQNIGIQIFISLPKL